jgi:hypothetical protein
LITCKDPSLYQASIIDRLESLVQFSALRRSVSYRISGNIQHSYRQSGDVSLDTLLLISSICSHDPRWPSLGKTPLHSTPIGMEWSGEGAHSTPLHPLRALRTITSSKLEHRFPGPTGCPELTRLLIVIVTCEFPSSSFMIL